MRALRCLASRSLHALSLVRSRVPVDSLGARRAPPPSLKVPLKDPLTSTADARQPGCRRRKIWNPSSRALTNPYAVHSRARRSPCPSCSRLRQPLVLGVSMLLVTSAVYLGFIHSNDSDVGTPIAVSGKVKTQHVRAAGRSSLSGPRRSSLLDGP